MMDSGSPRRSSHVPASLGLVAPKTPHQPESSSCHDDGGRGAEPCSRGAGRGPRLLPQVVEGTGTPRVSPLKKASPGHSHRRALGHGVSQEPDGTERCWRAALKLSEPHLFVSKTGTAANPTSQGQTGSNLGCAPGGTGSRGRPAGGSSTSQMEPSARRSIPWPWRWSRTQSPSYSSPFLRDKRGGCSQAGKGQVAV